MAGFVGPLAGPAGMCSLKLTASWVLGDISHPPTPAPGSTSLQHPICRECLGPQSMMLGSALCLSPLVPLLPLQLPAHWLRKICALGSCSSPTPG